MIPRSSAGSTPWPPPVVRSMACIDRGSAAGSDRAVTTDRAPLRNSWFPPRYPPRKINPRDPHPHGETTTMDAEIPESPPPAPPPAEAEREPQAELVAATEQAPPDAQTLVDRMVAAGEWPEPELLEQIVQAG